MKILATGVVLAVLLGSVAIASEPRISSTDGAACMEGPMSQFGRYVGDWKIEDERRAQDGSGWGPGKGARWIFKCVADGAVVQDYWFPNGGGFGTNLRIYNPDSGSWEIVWTAKRQNGLMHISAKANGEGNVVMDILSPEQNPPRRIIFYTPHENSWHWAQERSFDGGETWVEVYRIKATPWKPAADG